MRRALNIIGVTLLALVALIALGVLLVLGTEAGSRWALTQAPGVQVSGFEGRLGGRWQAERLIWQSGEQQVVVNAPKLDWRPSCLLRMTLCLDEMVVGDIELTFPPQPEPPAESESPFSLPDLNLPLAIELGHLELGRILLNGGEQLRGAQLAANWRADGLDITRLTAQREGLSAALSGRLQPEGAWPLTLEGEATLDVAEEAEPLQLDLQINGAVRNELTLTVTASGYVEAKLVGRIEPLAESLPATLTLTSDLVDPVPDLPDTLRLQDLELNASGTLDEGYALLGTARLPGSDGPVRLALQGSVDAQGAVLDTLELAAGPQRSVRLAGQATWADGLAAQARLDWQAFPWTWLYPQPEEPPVAVREASLEIDYDDGDYLGNFQAALDGPAGAFTLSSPFSGDLNRINLPQLELVAGQGSAEGSLSVGFAEGVDWRADLRLSDLDPSYWLAELPGQLGGRLRTEGAVAGGAVQAQADLQLSGRLRGQAAALDVQANGEGGQWQVPAVSLWLGDNRVDGEGRLNDQQLQARLDLDLPRLAQLWPGLGGSLSGQLKAAGTPSAPTGGLNLQGEALSFADNQITGLDLAATLAADETLSLDATATGLLAGGQDLGTLTLDVTGGLPAHRAELDLQGPTANVSLALEGSLADDQAWSGRLLRGSLAAFDQQWSLREPMGITRSAEGRIELAAHCWVSAPASLCGDVQRVAPEPSLDYRLRDFPLDRLATYLPDAIDWQGELNADFDVELPGAGPQGRVTVDAGPGTLRIRDGERWLDFPYQTLAIDSQLRPEAAQASVRFEGGALGELTLAATVDPREQRKPLEGEFSLRGLNLAVARPFAPQVEVLEGNLNGSGRLGGTLTEPEVVGQLVLSDGRIGGGELPTSFDDLRVAVQIEGQALDIDGSWRSGEAGRGSLEGTFSWQPALELDLRLTGQRLPVVVEPYAELEVEPDLRIALAGEQLAVSGRVAVPRGAITVRDLPPSTVKVSEDAVIIGEEAEQEAAPINLDMDVDVAVGEDRLTFSGFGLTAQLRGFLHIGNDMDTRGELNLVNGRYRAYGQRLNLRRARLLFTGPLSQPFLDIEAVRRIEEDDVTAGIRLTGRAEQPRTEVFAEPSMSQEQALSYLVLGRPLGADAGDSNLLAQAALGLGLAGGSKLTGGLAARLGIEDFQLDTQGTGDDTSVIASGRLTDRLSLRYGVGVFAPANTIALRYQLTRRLFLEAASGLANSLDLFYRRDF